MTETEVKKYVVTAEHQAFFSKNVSAPFGAKLWVIDETVNSVMLPTRVAKSEKSEVLIFQHLNLVTNKWMFTYTTQSLYGHETDHADAGVMEGEYLLLHANPDITIEEALLHYPNQDDKDSNDYKAIVNFKQAKKHGNTRVFLESL